MDKRERIIRAAVEVFREKGIEKTKVSDIVRKAEIAQGTFYLYFPSKLSVMPAIAARMAGQLEQEIRDTARPDEAWEAQIGRLVDAVFKVTGEYRDVAILVYAGLSSTEQVKEWEEIYMPLYREVAGLIRVWQENGYARQADPFRLARLSVGLIESAAEQVYLYDSYDPAQEKVQKEELLLFLQHALRR
ncbi:TetR family transcriptional regulator [Bhargavaea cecembensis]|uniref:TetR family transcriptional regulator n=1 Tax=Bhargavaea cecembensis TaxID=394098 RepID=UPI00058BB0BB|nr:TetR family transcriptional regulator [Bhargavaea cecembensis]